DPNLPDTLLRLANDKFRHRRMAVFEQSKKVDTRYFDRVYIKRRFPITIDDPKSTGVVMEYRDGTPAVVESRFGEGTVILASFPVNSKWSNLPLNGAEFVPLTLQIVRH